MAKIISLNTFSDQRGSLTVLERILPFDIKRVYFIYNVDNSVRGGHRHISTIQAAICIKGSCKIYTNNNEVEDEHLLDSPDKCLILFPEDWHEMSDFSEDAVLLVLASELFNTEDYIYEKY